MIPKYVRPATERRRALQPLWNAFDRVLKPRLDQGVWLAVSGGPDSLALMESAARWPSRSPDLRGVISIDHGMRAAAAAECDFVAARARVLGFESRVVRVFASKADEATLRTARYEAILRVLHESQAHSICTAHHRDDDAEGLLMDLFGWGGGRQGAGMSANSPLGDRNLLRPFVGVGREQLQVALFHLGVKRWVQDPLDVRRVGKRALVRHEILPVLARFQPQIALRMGTRAAQIAEQEQYFTSLCAAACERRGAGYFVPQRPVEQVALVRREIQEILRQITEVDPRRATPTIERILAAAGYRDGPSQPGRSFDLPGCRAWIAPDGILLGPV